MKLTLTIGASPLRQWHLDLIDRLRMVPGLDASLDGAGRQRAQPQRLSDAPGGGQARSHPAQSRLFTAVAASNGVQQREASSAPADLILALEDAPASATSRNWRLLFDGQPGEAALLAAAAAGRMPLVEIMAGDVLVAAGRPGSENNRAPQAMLDDLLSRMITLIVAVV